MGHLKQKTGQQILPLKKNRASFTRVHINNIITGLETKISEHSPSGHSPKSVFTCSVILKPWMANLPLWRKFPCFCPSYSPGEAVFLSLDTFDTGRYLHTLTLLVFEFSESKFSHCAALVVDHETDCNLFLQ